MLHTFHFAQDGQLGTKSGSTEALNTWHCNGNHGWQGPDTPSGFTKRWQSHISPCRGPSPSQRCMRGWLGGGCCSCPSPRNQAREVPRKSLVQSGIMKQVLAVHFRWVVCIGSRLADLPLPLLSRAKGVGDKWGQWWGSRGAASVLPWHDKAICLFCRWSGCWEGSCLEPFFLAIRSHGEYRWDEGGWKRSRSIQVS